MELKDFIPALKYGVQVVTDEITNLAITAAKLATSLDLSGKTLVLPTTLNLNSLGSVFPIVNPATATVVGYTADAVLVAADLGKILTNTGSSGTVVLTLPAVAAAIGKTFRLQLTVAQIVRLLPAAGEAIALGGSAVVTKYLNIPAVIGNYVNVYCDGTRYIVLDYAGVLTKEA